MALNPQPVGQPRNGLRTAPPKASPENPYLPSGPTEMLVFEQFMGINTSTTRPGVDDKQMWWCDGWMPIGPRYLRTMPGAGERLWQVPTSSIVFFSFANIGPTPIMIAVLANGSIYQVNTTTGAQTLMASAGTIQNPSRLNVGISQYGSQYVLIVANQTNGYFIWDGTVLYMAGSLAPGVTITNVGSGYTSAPTVTASGGSGSGATFVATVANGVITKITITNPGTGYVAGDTPTLSITGGGGSAGAATIALMPFAISGTTIETYAGRVWVANGAAISFSAPGSVSNFSTASGGGNFTSSDSFLRVRYVQLLQTNGFLYLIADSSVNYISGVQTTGSPPTTTFTNQNADPETGSPWPSTVGTFGRNILFANAFGVHVSYGAAVTKISEALDGVYNTVPNFGGLIPSTAKAIVYGKKIWMLLLPIVDPVSGLQVNKLCIWNGKTFWWTSEQDVTLTYIQNQEIDSVLTAWGTDGTSVYPLFQTPSAAFKKTVQSKLFDRNGGYEFNKTATRLWGLAQYFSLESPLVTVSIDTEISSGADTHTVPFAPIEIEWTNNSGDPISWTNSSGDPIVWYSSNAGIVVMAPYAVGQQGALLGLTAQTNAADMALISLKLRPETYNYRG